MFITNDPTTPTRWMTLTRWIDCTGYSRDAFNGKRRQGVYVEGKHWIKAPDGKLLVDWRAIENWMESNYDDETTGRREGGTEESPRH